MKFYFSHNWKKLEIDNRKKKLESLQICGNK